MAKKTKRKKNKVTAKKQPLAQNTTVSDQLSSRLIHAGQLSLAGQHQEVLNLCMEELNENPMSGHAHNTLGVTFLHMEKPEDALRHFAEAVALDQTVSQFHFNKALTEQYLGQIANCIESAQKALTLNPDYIEAWNTLGLAYNSLGEYEPAKNAFKNAIRIDADHGEAWVNLCGVLQELEAGQEAISAGKRGVELRPDLPESYYNLARAYDSVERWEESIIEYQKCISAFPDYARAYINVSRSLSSIGEHVLAENLGRNAIQMLPDNPLAYTNTGLGIFGQGRYREALEMYRKVLEIDPESVAAHNNIAHTALAIEEFSYGWEEYEYGFLTGHRGPLRSSGIPFWEGEAVGGKTIHVVGEQGIGEQLMFSTMIPDLVADGANVVFECEKRLAPLYQRSCPDITVVPLALIKEPQSPVLDEMDIDFRCAVGSLGRKYRTSVGDFHPREGFLKADEALVRKCRERYQTDNNDLIIGISWRSGSKRHGTQKNIDIEFWEPILRLPRCRFVSLQYGEVSEDVAKAKEHFGVDIVVDPEISALASLEQCAAQISAVDLVISISNATVHMAGALGKEAWMMLSLVPCWHWFVDRPDSLWYKSVSKHRQAGDRDWIPVIESVASRLQTKLASKPEL